MGRVSIAKNSRRPALGFATNMVTSPGADGCVLHWFRRDLRVHDNVALKCALDESQRHGLSLLPVFIFEDYLYNRTVCSPIRVRFVIETVEALARNLKKHSLTLRISRGNSTKIIPAIVQAAHAKLVTFEQEYDQCARDRDDAVLAALKEQDVEVRQSHGFTLYDPDLLLKLGKGTAPLSMSGFLTHASQAPAPDTPIELDEALSGVSDATVKNIPNDIQFSDNIPTVAQLGCQDEDEDETSNIGPTKQMHLPGGEDEGLKRMHDFMQRDDGKAVRKFSKPDTSPAQLAPRSTTLLSAYLAHGALSSRTLWHALNEVTNGKDDVSQTSLKGQLLWREHFWLLMFQIPNFEKMKGNPVCRQIEWRDVKNDKDAQDLLDKWTGAETGYPWIDALMIQLRTEGFVHHLGRHSLACFLTRGDLWISWEEGVKVFRKYLIDHDHALNAANWMWLSASAFFNRYFRIYSPVTFARKWDADGAFVKHYLPILKNMPQKYVHEPWKAPNKVQQEAGCVIGKDYPFPVVDHDVVRKENVQKMKVQYARKEYGSPSHTHKRGNNEDSGDDSCDNETDNDDAIDAGRVHKRAKRNN